MVDNLWYADGLRFTCTQCGNCCTGPPGYVWCSDNEARALAAALGISDSDFLIRYTRVLQGRRSLTEVRTQYGHDCVLLRRSGPGQAWCAAYDARPLQCRTWPFWPENLASLEEWQRSARRCPGMAAGIVGHGARHALVKIATQRDLRDPGNGSNKASPPAGK